LKPGAADEILSRPSIHACSGLRAHMQGKSCFNFKTVDEALFRELARVTAESLHGMKKAGYVAARLKETI
jgi:hypothetical protein